MATTVETQITITADGDGIESEWSPTAMSNSAGAAGGPVRMLLAAGDNYVAVPTGAMGYAILPPAASAVTKRLKHHSGETGIAMRTGQPIAMSLATGVATMMIHASAEELIYLHWT
jgi:hypothetical protein